MAYLTNGFCVALKVIKQSFYALRQIKHNNYAEQKTKAKRIAERDTDYGKPIKSLKTGKAVLQFIYTHTDVLKNADLPEEKQSRLRRWPPPGGRTMRTRLLPIQKVLFL